MLARLPGYEGNPYATLTALADGALNALDTPDFAQLITQAGDSQARYLKGAPLSRRVAYFSAEFGVDASLPIYSGGLGVLAGDHLKAASDAGLPLVAIGLLYHGGYLRQTLDDAGWQHEEYPRLDLALTGLRLERDDAGAPIQVSIPLGDRETHAQVWRADIGRVPLYLLDTDIEANSAIDREITQRLYDRGNDHRSERDIRICQEIVLGIGGVRALRALGYDALETFHLNEGHASFLLLERAREAHAAGKDYDAALDETREHAVFTTHTPVPAGHDRFAHDLLLYYLGPWWRDTLGFTDWQLLSLGGAGDFSMTELALNVTRAVNAVSVKHGEVSRAMFPGRPIGSITNGVHHPTWTGPHAAALYDRALPNWREDGERLRGADGLAARDVRAAHDAAKRDMIAAVNARYPGAALEEGVFTIGFARRMTGYKRATLLFRDPARLAAVAARGLQVVVAGKAHPRDDEGKSIIAEIVRHAGDAPVRVIFVAGYDMALARLLVAGSDIWLNNPHRPMEASGTSGMKALLNGVPNLSVLDGWWIEGYRGTNGWPIGEGYSGGDEDSYDAGSLYDTLERDVIPEYYDRPDDWTARMTRAIATSPDFRAQRMVLQ
ncbi:MAG: alpha-glucan family phosphorylase, partial [Chloroflexota bacterium]|nr:alpha-glucan family phosphorylase [Chloroflexota bacterium]